MRDGAPRYVLGGLLGAREVRERQAERLLREKAEALRQAQGEWQAARRETEGFRTALRAREAEQFRALGDGAPAGDWARAREEVRRLRDALALLEEQEARALRAGIAAEADQAAARAAWAGRVKERARLDAHREEWRVEAARAAEAAEESESEP